MISKNFVKPWKTNSRVDYNLISNLSFKDHHFESPEKRPSYYSNVSLIKNLTIKVNN